MPNSASSARGARTARARKRTSLYHLPQARVPEVSFSRRGKSLSRGATRDVTRARARGWRAGSTSLKTRRTGPFFVGVSRISLSRNPEGSLGVAADSDGVEGILESRVTRTSARRTCRGRLLETSSHPFSTSQRTFNGVAGEASRGCRRSSCARRARWRRPRAWSARSRSKRPRLHTRAKRLEGGLPRAQFFSLPLSLTKKDAERSSVCAPSRSLSASAASASKAALKLGSHQALATSRGPIAPGRDIASLASTSTCQPPLERRESARARAEEEFRFGGEGKGAGLRFACVRGFCFARRVSISPSRSPTRRRSRKLRPTHTR